MFGEYSNQAQENPSACFLQDRILLKGSRLKNKNFLFMNLAVLQYYPEFGEKEANLLKVEKMLSKAAFDLVVLPELFATGYLFTSKHEVKKLSEEILEGPTVQMFSNFCRGKKVYACFGILEREGDRFYNSSLLVGPQGIMGHYRKLHLFYEEKKWFTPGNFPLSVTEINGIRVGMMICFDWRFPEAARTLALMGADLILHPSNLVLPHCPDAMITRALENRVFCATSNRIGTEKRGGKSLTYIGQSQIVDPDGKILVRLSGREEKVAVAAIDYKKAHQKKINFYNDLFLDRRENFYKVQNHLPLKLKKR